MLAILNIGLTITDFDNKNQKSAKKRISIKMG